MVYRKKKQIKVVSAESPQAFERELNAVLSLVATSENVVSYELKLMEQLGLCAYVIYEEKSNIPETIAEKMEAAGLGRTCKDCGNFIPPSDKRVKYVNCAVGDCRSHAEMRACETCYVVDGGLSA